MRSTVLDNFGSLNCDGLGALPDTVSTYLDPTWQVYVRHYANGMVLVNPTDTARPIDLGATTYRATPSGGLVPSDGSAPSH